MTSILPKLYAIYQSAGFHPMTGHAVNHVHHWRGAPMTRFIKDGQLIGTGGLSLFEVMFMEGLAAYVQPQRILVLGNALGWSTLALALIFPQAKVLGIDLDETGNLLTNILADNNKLNAFAAKGFLPDDIGALSAQHLQGPVDFILIDADHTNEAVLKDYAACQKIATADCVTIFHDILNLNMADAFNKISQSSPLCGRFLTRTPSGMAMLYSSANASLDQYVKCFSDETALFKSYRQRVSQMSDFGRQEDAINTMI